MAHTDPFIFLPIVIWVFISFWGIYFFFTGIGFPIIFTSYRTRMLAKSYFIKDFYNQIWGVLGFYIIFKKTWQTMSSLIIKYFRVSKLTFKTKVFYTHMKINYLTKRIRKSLNII